MDTLLSLLVRGLLPDQQVADLRDKGIVAYRMQNYGIVLFDPRENTISVLEHNLSSEVATTEVARLRTMWFTGIRPLVFPHNGLHEAAEAENCADCRNALGAMTKQLEGRGPLT